MFQHSGDTNYCVKENEEKSTKHNCVKTIYAGRNVTKL